MGTMELPPFANLAFELSSYAIAIYVLIKLKHEERFHMFVFIAAIIATITAELIGLRVSQGYYYSDFLIKIGGRAEGMPLAIAVDWAVIMTCMWRMGTRLDIPWYLLPFVLAFLALPLDLAMDPVASVSKIVPHDFMSCMGPEFPAGAAKGLGYWTWCVSPVNKHQFFGVPLGNFVGWYMLVVAFSFCVIWAHRKLEGTEPGYGKLALVTLGIVVGTCAIEFGVLWVFMQLEGAGISSIHIFLALMAVGLIAIISSGNRRHSRDIEWWVLLPLAGDTLLCLAAYIGYMRHHVEFQSALIIFGLLLFSLVSSLWVMRGWLHELEEEI
jgi:hypothetical protein